MTQEIDFYGIEDNYIHLKFGDARKMYNFTEDFKNSYPDFTREYERYWNGESSKFKGPFAIVEYVYSNKLPIRFYYNYTDTPAKNKREIMAYLVRENSYVGNLNEIEL